MEQFNLFYEAEDKVEDDSNTRVCIECDKRKPLEMFSTDIQAHQGRKTTCRECKEESRRIVHSYRKTHRYPDKNYACPICEKKQDGIRRTGHSWNVDHCHTTGIVRGYLCHRCNTGLGLLREDINILTKAIEWLNKGEQLNVNTKLSSRWRSL